MNNITYLTELRKSIDIIDKAQELVMEIEKQYSRLYYERKASKDLGCVDFTEEKAGQLAAYERLMDIISG